MEDYESYVVPEELKKIWKIELDLLRKFKEVCAKYNLRYYATGGTLLGAARHKGFIPWDDDIDLLLPWRDCDKLLEVAEKEFTYPYFLQSHLSEKNGELSNFRLRRCDTTGCTRWEYENVGDPDYNKGVFINLFPIYYVPTDPEVRAKQKALILEAWQAFRGYTALEGEANGLRHVNPEYAKYVDVYRRYSEKYTIQEIKKLYFERCAMQQEPDELVGATAFRVHDPKNVWPTAWFSETVELPFENTTVTAVKEYDRMLTIMYGDWRVPVFNTQYHEMFVFDADVPYAENPNLKV